MIEGVPRPPGRAVVDSLPGTGAVSGARASGQLTNVFQGALAQEIRIALPGFRKLDDLPCYRIFHVVAAVSDLQGDASLFERDA